MLYGYQPLSKAVGAEFSEYRKITDKVIDPQSSFLAFSSVYFSLLFLARWWHEMTDAFKCLLTFPCSLFSASIQAVSWLCNSLTSGEG